MDISKLSSAQLAQAIGLVKEREALEARLERVISSLASLEAGGTGLRRGRKPGRPPGKVGRPPGRPPGRPAGKRRGKRLKEPLMKLLKSSGSGGITVKELADKLKVKPNNVFSWFYTTGKKVSGIKKVGEARYAFNG